MSAAARAPRARASSWSLVDLAHQRGGVLESTARPRSRRPGSARRPAPTSVSVPVDEVGVGRRHEVGVAGEAGGDHRLAERHRLGQREPEALGAVQRDVAVGAREQRGHLARVESTRSTSRMSGRSPIACAAARAPAGRKSALIVLSTSVGPSPGANARLNASTSPSGFLRSSVEKKSNANRNTKPSGSVERHRRARRVRRLDRQRHHDDRHVGGAREVLGDVGRVHPELVDERRTAASQRSGMQVGLPGPLARSCSRRAARCRAPRRAPGVWSALTHSRLTSGSHVLGQRRAPRTRAPPGAAWRRAASRSTGGSTEIERVATGTPAARSART